MRKLPYQLVVVFTDQAFGGNPLAVFTEGQGVTSPVMQQIAKEMNLSETVFVQKPTEDDALARQLRKYSQLSGLPFWCVAREPAGRPRRLKIEAASYSVEVEEFAGEIKMRGDAAFHRLEVDLAQTNAAASDKLIFV